MNNNFIYRLSLLIIIPLLSTISLHHGNTENKMSESSAATKYISKIEVKPTPEMPLLSATLDYIKKNENAGATQPRQVFPIPTSIDVYSLFWIDDKNILVNSFQGNAFSFSGFDFHKLSLGNGKVSPYGEFPFRTLDKIDPVGLTMYATRENEELRLWNVSRYEQPQLPYSQLNVSSKGVEIEHMRESFAQSEELRQQLKGQMLRPFGVQTEKCTNTSGESTPIIIRDILGNESARFELPSAQKEGFQKFRIEPTVQPLTIATKDYFVGLLMTTDAQSPCFTERPSLDLQIFRTPRPLQEKENHAQKVEYKTIHGKSTFYHKLLEKWKVRGWSEGTIEWANLLNKDGAVVFRRDTRVGQELWCSEIWYYDEKGRETLIDFKIAVKEGNYLYQFTTNKSENMIQEPYHADYWGIGYQLIPVISPNRQKIAYVKGNEIWIVNLLRNRNK